MAQQYPRPMAIPGPRATKRLGCYTRYIPGAAVLACLLLTACGGTQSAAPVFDNPQADNAAKRAGARPLKTGATHQVQRGDTLYSIAWKYGYDYKDLAQWNNIKPPYRIYTGQTLVLSAPAARPVPAKISSAPTASPPAQTPSAGPQPLPAVADSKTGDAELADSPAPAEPDDSDNATGPIVWKWPARGRIVQSFANGGKGLSIAGQEGEPVKAAAPGRVVYSGNGIAGLGELVIVKHNKFFLSAYAYSKKRLVKEDDNVTLGQPIAEMGKGPGGGQVVLYFEIRKDGKPVDPAQYLPKRSR